ncbi:single-stranded DNA-binding protein [Candidatus Microgenomates bacterium]|jgi:single-strand DNA-binding protein|nr:MAG: single-stranded DNA-binding protein [Candidatus Microgenomates bacterium]
MSSRSLNKVQLIGNLTRDPELRYTPQGTAVCTFGLATNRSWTTETSEKREETEFHRIVAWNKLAELCSQLLFKGRKVYVEGRLQTRTWTAQDGSQRQATEVVIEEMIILDNRQAGENTEAVQEVSAGVDDVPVSGEEISAKPAAKKDKEEKPEKESPEEASEETPSEDDLTKDIPF